MIQLISQHRTESYDSHPVYHIILIPKKIKLIIKFGNRLFYCAGKSLPERERNGQGFFIFVDSFFNLIFFINLIQTASEGCESSEAGSENNEDLMLDFEGIRQC